MRFEKDWAKTCVLKRYRQHLASYVDFRFLPISVPCSHNVAESINVLGEPNDTVQSNVISSRMSRTAH
jgi:hypothetical protein